MLEQASQEKPTLLEFNRKLAKKSDYLHLILNYPSNIPVDDLVKYLKSCPSRILRKK
ncbi:MAG: transposase [Desulfovibrionaceae bacterium]|nr:transposase [Desulfovibrionaceae bacterium]